MNCVKMELCLKPELTKADLARLNVVAFKPRGKGKIWPIFQTMRPSWAPSPASPGEAVQLTEDLKKVSRFVAWFEHSEDTYYARSGDELPVVRLGDGPLRSQEIEWIAFPTPEPVRHEALSLNEQERAQLLKLAGRPAPSLWHIADVPP
jgi:hypothetical protein